MVSRLAQTAPGALQLGSRVDRLVPGNGAVEVTFGDGRVDTVDLVVAADGIRSGIREALFSPVSVFGSSRGATSHR